MKYYLISCIVFILAGCASTTNEPLIYNPEAITVENLATIQTPKAANLEGKNVFRVSIFSVLDSINNRDAIAVPSFMSNERRAVTLAPGRYIFTIQCNNTDMSFPASEMAEVESGNSYVVYCEPILNKNGFPRVNEMKAVIVKKSEY